MFSHHYFAAVSVPVHLWKYPGGYPVLNKATGIYRTDKVYAYFCLSCPSGCSQNFIVHTCIHIHTHAKSFSGNLCEIMCLSYISLL